MRTRKRNLALFLLMSLVVFACADPTQSEEYLALQGELDDAKAAAAESSDELTGVQDQLDEANDELESLRAEFVEASDKLAAAEADVERLTTELEEEMARIEPYPQVMIDLFVEGCTEGDPEFAEPCTCTMEEIQKVMPLADFLEISFAFFEAEIDPVTGEPDADFFAIPGADVFFRTFFDCIFA